MPAIEQTTIEGKKVGYYITTQCYFSSEENSRYEEGSKKGELRREISRTDTLYSTHLYRSFSDGRPSVLLERPCL